MAISFISGFTVSFCVDDPRFLFGWNIPGGLLDQALGKLARGEAFMVRGERRSGKTSFLNCLKARIYDELSNITVASVNFLSEQGAGAGSPLKAHKLILEKILEALFEDDRLVWLEDSLSLGNMVFTRDEPDIGVDGIDDLSTVRRCLKRLNKLLQEHSHRVVIFFDEYESMYEAFGGGTNYFQLYRDFQQNSRSGGISSIIAGAESVDSFSGRTGSDQFNLHHPLYITGIDKNSFLDMWRHCLEECSPLCRDRVEAKVEELGGVDTVYEFCGGRPSYAKTLGDYWASGKEGDAPGLLQWFRQILKRLTHQSDECKQLLVNIASERQLGQLSKDMSAALNDLLLLDHVWKDNRSEIHPWKIRGGLWKEFLKEYDESVVPEEREEFEVMSINEIRDGLDLAAWLLGQRDFSTDMLHLCRETDWLEFKRALYCKKPETGGTEIDYFPGLCSECRRRKNGNANDKCWQTCEVRNEVNWKVSEAVIALANTGGGALLLGVDDTLSEIGYIPTVLRDGCKDHEEFFRMRLHPAILPETGEWIITSNKKWRVEEESENEYRHFRNCETRFVEKAAEDGSLYSVIYVESVDPPILLRFSEGTASEKVCPIREKGVGEVVPLTSKEERAVYASKRFRNYSRSHYQREARELRRKLRDFRKGNFNMAVEE